MNIYELVLVNIFSDYNTENAIWFIQSKQSYGELRDYYSKVNEKIRNKGFYIYVNKVAFSEVPTLEDIMNIIE